MKPVLLVLSLLSYFQFHAQVEYSCWAPRSTDPKRAFFFVSQNNPRTIYPIITLEKMSYIQFKQQQNLRSLKHPKGYKTLSIHYPIRFDYNYANNKTATTIALNEYHFLKLQRDPNFICKLVLHPEWTYYSEIASQRIESQYLEPIFFKPAEIDVFQTPVFITEYHNGVMRNRKSCKAVIRTITKDPNCVKGMGVSANCSSYVTYELTDPEDQKEFGQYFTTVMDESSKCIQNTYATLYLTKYSDGRVNMIVSNF